MYKLEVIRNAFTITDLSTGVVIFSAPRREYYFDEAFLGSDNTIRIIALHTGDNLIDRVPEIIIGDALDGSDVLYTVQSFQTFGRNYLGHGAIVDQGGQVQSVFGRTGAVAAAPGDYTADQIVETANRVFTTAARKASMDGLIVHYQLPLINIAAMKAVPQATIGANERRYIIGEGSDYFYDSTANSGIAPDDQVGGTGFWNRASVIPVEVTLAGDNDFTGENTFTSTVGTNIPIIASINSTGSGSGYAIAATAGGNNSGMLIITDSDGTSAAIKMRVTTGYAISSANGAGTETFSVDKDGAVVGASFTGDGSMLTGIVHPSAPVVVQYEFIDSDYILPDSNTLDDRTIVVKNVTLGDLNINTVISDSYEGLSTQVIGAGESHTIKKYQTNDYRIV